MILKKNKADIAIMCKSHNYRKVAHCEHGSNEYRVGNWIIGKDRRDGLIGGTVVLTETRTSPAYMGGKILWLSPTSDGKCEILFKEDKSLVGNDDAVGHSGWGRWNRGVCYI